MAMIQSDRGSIENAMEITYTWFWKLGDESKKSCEQKSFGAVADFSRLTHVAAPFGAPLWTSVNAVTWGKKIIKSTITKKFK